jgi:MYXO-CTERM domain-containing protein
MRRLQRERRRRATFRWLALAAALLCMLPALAHARAARPDPLRAESGCDHYRGSANGANDATQQFELMVCTTPEGIRAKVQTSSLVSGWSVRQSVGNWDAAGQVLTLREIEFLESRPELGWHFCLIDSIVLEKTAEGLSGSYESLACDDRAQLELVKLGPVEAVVPAGANTPTPPPSRPPQQEPELKSGGCACDVSSTTTSTPPLGLLALLVLTLAFLAARRHTHRTLALLACMLLPLLGSGCIPECGGLNPNCEAKCTETGECGKRTYKAGDAYARCYVRSSDDCAQSQACKQRGACHLYDGIDPGNCVALTDLDCQQSSECAQQGKCSLGDRGRCVIEPSGCQRTDGCKRDGTCVYAIGGRCVAGEIDCKQACRLEGACTLQDGVCVATSAEDCQRSHACGHGGQCSLADNRCIAASAGDCATSQMCKLNGWCHAIEGGDGCFDGRTECGQLCWERGDCKRIDGTCQPGEASSCAPSLACMVMGQCSVTGRPAVMCGAADDADCEQSLECKAFGRCTNEGIMCVGESGRSPSSSVGCLRDPECASKGRCLTNDDGRCVTAVEAGLPDWKPPPPLP